MLATDEISLEDGRPFDLKDLRPQFLKILCILTFIGSSMMLIKGVVDYTNAEFAARIIFHVSKDSMQVDQQAPHSDKSNSFFKNMLRDVRKTMTPEKIRHEAIGTLLSSLLCLAGAILMWYLHKPGFFIYCLGVILGIAVPYYIFGNAPFVTLKAIPLAFIGIIFIIFYGMNLKSMNGKQPSKA